MLHEKTLSGNIVHRGVSEVQCPHLRLRRRKRAKYGIARHLYSPGRYDSMKACLDLPRNVLANGDPDKAD